MAHYLLQIIQLVLHHVGEIDTNSADKIFGLNQSLQPNPIWSKQETYPDHHH